MSASEDCTAKIWSLDADDGRPELTLVHEEWVRHALFSPDSLQARKRLRGRAHIR